MRPQPHVAIGVRGLQVSEPVRLWWVLWQMPEGLPLEDLAPKWHPHMFGFETGAGDNFITYAGPVWAASAEAAKAIVLSNYGLSADTITWRGHEPREVPDDWKPSDRFDVARFPPKPTGAP